MEDGLLFRREVNEAPFRCIEGDEVAKVLSEVRVGECDEHQWGLRLSK